MTARHLDQNTMGYLQWRWGPNSAMTTSLVRDTKSSHFTLALQVNAGCKRRNTRRPFRTQIAALRVVKLFFFPSSTALILRHSHTIQLGVPHSYLMMSYQYKFQDEEQTKVKGSVKYVSAPFYI